MNVYRICANDDPLTVLAKQAAVISVYSIDNPLHCCFEDKNFRAGDDMSFEKAWNKKVRDKNGERMYEYIKTFLDAFSKLSANEQRKVFRLYLRKADYLGNKVLRRVRELTENTDKHKGLVYRHFLSSDGSIYITTKDEYTGVVGKF